MEFSMNRSASILPIHSTGPSPAYQALSTNGGNDWSIPTPTTEDPRIKPTTFDQQQKQGHPVPKALNLWARCQEWWWLEITSSILAAACLTFTVALLVALDGMTLDDWPLVVSPNALLNIISTTARVAILFPIAECLSQLKWQYFYQRRPHPLVNLQVFEDASRGPLGAALFLWGIGFRKSTVLASIASILTISALAIGSLTQQALEIRIRSVAREDHSATVGAAQIYNFTGDGRIEALHIGSAIYRGLFGEHSAPTFHCPTGSCSWPEYSTLGICSQCNDVSNATKVECETFPTGGSEVCTFTTPDGARIDMSGFWNPPDNSYSSYTAYNGTGIPNLVAPPQADGILTAFTAVDFPDPSLALKDATVSECATWLCAKLFQDTYVKNGIFYSGPFTEFPLAFVKEDPYDWYHVSYEIPPNTTKRLEGHDVVFQLPLSLQQALQNSMDPLFHTSVSSNDKWSEFGPSYAGLALSQRPLAVVLQNISQELTGLIQSSHLAKEVFGKTFEDKAYIKFRWQWAIPPIALVFLSIALLVAVILRSAHVRPRWKSSSLALLLHALKGPRTDHYYQLNSVPEMERLAAEIDVRAERTEGGGHRFVEQDSAYRNGL